METELQKLKSEIKILKRYTFVTTTLLLSILLISATYRSYTVIQAHKFEVIDYQGNVVQTIDQYGIHGNYQEYNNNQPNNRVRFLYNKLGSSSGFIQINNLQGTTIETINYFSHFSEKITINNTVNYIYNANTNEVSLQNAIVVGKAEGIDKAIDVAIFHYVNNIYEPSR